MEISEAQKKLLMFDKARGWDKHWNLKDLLLNITEEGGEIWTLIKWVEDEKQRQIVKDKIAEVSDYIGDTLFLILKIANQTGVDANQSLQNTLDEYEKRMPSDTMKKVGHANKLVGGVDNK